MNSHPRRPRELAAALARLAPPIAKDWSTANELPAGTPAPVAAMIDACHAAAMLPAAGPTAVKPNQPRINEAMALPRQSPVSNLQLLQLNAELDAGSDTEKTRSTVPLRLVHMYSSSKEPNEKITCNSRLSQWNAARSQKFWQGAANETRTPISQMRTAVPSTARTFLKWFLDCGFQIYKGSIGCRG